MLGSLLSNCPVEHCVASESLCDEERGSVKASCQDAPSMVAPGEIWKQGIRRPSYLEIGSSVGIKHPSCRVEKEWMVNSRHGKRPPMHVHCALVERGC